ncbi:hypothetical protein [Cupriavidus sp. IDO]|uniref:hypothetical protein n=1 Tax=Cupriavidus sp. IDO TaxID=1539142 RepID=UPI00126A2B90|nr:hypothetical protein [Cupriavidus sp. IDO]
MIDPYAVPEAVPEASRLTAGSQHFKVKLNLKVKHPDADSSGWTHSDHLVDPNADIEGIGTKVDVPTQ